jgi:hypothetical protein
VPTGTIWIALGILGWSLVTALVVTAIGRTSGVFEADEASAQRREPGRLQVQRRQ